MNRYLRPLYKPIFGATLSAIVGLIPFGHAVAHETRDFIWYCESQDATPAQRHTVSIMAESVGMNSSRNSCRDIYAKLKRADYVNLADAAISDIAPIAEFKQIESLNVSHNQIESTEALDNLPNLDRIDISHNLITKIPTFANSPKLNDVTAGFNPITSLDGIGNLRALKKLAIDATGIEDFSALSGMKLTQLSARFLTGKPDISTLSNLPSLTVLNLDESFELEDLSAFGQFKNLKTLSARYSNISSVAGISGLSKLRKVTLEGNRIETIQSGQFPQRVSTLDLSNNPISDFSFVKSMKRLTWTLNIDKTGFHDWQQIGHLLEHLQNFYAAFTPVEEIVITGKPLWQKLANLDLGGTKITSLWPLTKVSADDLRNFYGPEVDRKNGRDCPTKGVPESVAKFCSFMY